MNIPLKYYLNNIIDPGYANSSSKKRWGYSKNQGVRYTNDLNSFKTYKIETIFSMIYKDLENYKSYSVNTKIQTKFNTLKKMISDKTDSYKVSHKGFLGFVYLIFSKIFYGNIDILMKNLTYKIDSFLQQPIENKEIKHSIEDNVIEEKKLDESLKVDDTMEENIKIDKNMNDVLDELIPIVIQHTGIDQYLIKDGNKAPYERTNDGEIIFNCLTDGMIIEVIKKLGVKIFTNDHSYSARMTDTSLILSSSQSQKFLNEFDDLLKTPSGLKKESDFDILMNIVIKNKGFDKHLIKKDNVLFKLPYERNLLNEIIFRCPTEANAKSILEKLKDQDLQRSIIIRRDEYVSLVLTKSESDLFLKSSEHELKINNVLDELIPIVIQHTGIDQYLIKDGNKASYERTNDGEIIFNCLTDGMIIEVIKKLGVKIFTNDHSYSTRMTDTSLILSSSQSQKFLNEFDDLLKTPSGLKKESDFDILMNIVIKNEGFDKYLIKKDNVLFKLPYERNSFNEIIFRCPTEANAKSILEKLKDKDLQGLIIIRDEYVSLLLTKSESDLFLKSSEHEFSSELYYS